MDVQKKKAAKGPITQTFLFRMEHRLQDDSFVVEVIFCSVERASTVRKIRALSNLDDVAVKIADVTPNLAVLGDWLRNELGSSTFP